MRSRASNWGFAVRKLLGISVAALLALPLAACEETATTNLTEPAEVSQGANQSANTDVITEEAPLLNLETFQAEGVVTLRRKSDNGTMSWQLRTSADRPPGNSFTV